MKEFNRPTMLMILDGYGINQDTYGNAIAAADKPHLDEIFAKYPGTTLKACGLDVGLPEGQMGNSEVGHLNIGAGRIVYQDLTMITKAIEDGSFFNNEALQKAIAHVRQRLCPAPLGLLSDGGSPQPIKTPAGLSSTWRKRSGSKPLRSLLPGRQRRTPSLRRRIHQAAGRPYERNWSRQDRDRIRAATTLWTVTSGGIASKKPTTP